MTRPADFFERAIAALHDANEAAWRETNPEDGVRHFTNTTRELLGDPGALERPDAFKPGEKQFVVSGAFFIAPSRDHMILFADNFGQRHARISVTDSRPGHTVQTKQAAVVPNTDVDPIFRPDTELGPRRLLGLCAGDVEGRGDRHVQHRRPGPLLSRRDRHARAEAVRCLGGCGVDGLGGPALVASVADSLGPWNNY